jgi:hypothetical protein
MAQGFNAKPRKRQAAKSFDHMREEVDGVESDGHPNTNSSSTPIPNFSDKANIDNFAIS